MLENKLYILKNGNKIKSRPRNKNHLIVNGLHKPIINEECWNIVQNKLQQNTPAVPHNNIVKNPLAGIIYCEKCGKPMQRRPYNKNGKEEALICNNSKCDNISTKLNLVEEKIIEALKIWLKSYSIDYEKINKMKRISKISTEKDILEQLKKKLEKEKTKESKIYEYFEDGTYTKEIFKERINNVTKCIKELEEKIIPLQEKVNEQEKKLESKKQVIPKIQNVLDIYGKLETNEEKNILLKTIIEKVTYLKTKKAIKKNSDPTCFEIHIYPKIPKI